MYKTLLKQPIFYFIFFILVFGLSLQASNPSNEWDSSFFTYNDNQDEITGFSNAGKQFVEQGNTQLVIPAASPNQTPITAIGENAFQNSGITSLTLSPVLTTIKGSAFSENPSLTTVSWNNALVSIETNAFLHSGLTGEFPKIESLLVIGYGAFQGNKLQKVSLPDTIRDIYPYAFAENQIEEVDLGSLENLHGLRWEAELNIQAGGGIVSHHLFYKNKIKSLTLPNKKMVNGTEKGIWALGRHAFSFNDLTELSLPHNIVNLYSQAFYSNKNLSKLTFETTTNAEGHKVGVVQIDFGAFSECNLTGELVFPDIVNEIGGFTFANNKLTKLSLPKYGLGLGYNAFDSNPLESITFPHLKTWLFEESAFQNTNSLKNIDFQYYNPLVTKVVTSTFKNGKLKSLNIPSSFKEISNSAFAENTGWYEGTNAVALYRIDNLKTAQTEGYRYNLDNSLADTENYVFNPVLFSIRFTDENGNLINEISSQAVTLTRNTNSNPSAPKEIILENGKADFINFKLGDTLQVALPVLENYELVKSGEPAINSANEFTFTLHPEKTVDTKYSDDYEVGFKKAELHIVYRAKKQDTPLLPYVPDKKEDTPKKEIPETIVPESKPSVEPTVPPISSSAFETNDEETEPDKNNPSETAEIIPDETTPQGPTELPKTSGMPTGFYLLFGFAFMGIGYLFRKE